MFRKNKRCHRGIQTGFFVVLQAAVFRPTFSSLTPAPCTTVYKVPDVLLKDPKQRAEIFPKFSSGTSPQMKPEEGEKTQRTGLNAEPNSWRNIAGTPFDSKIQRAETNKRGGADAPQKIKPWWLLGQT